MSLEHRGKFDWLGECAKDKYGEEFVEEIRENFREEYNGRGAEKVLREAEEEGVRTYKKTRRGQASNQFILEIKGREVKKVDI